MAGVVAQGARRAPCVLAFTRAAELGSLVRRARPRAPPLPMLDPASDSLQALEAALPGMVLPGSEGRSYPLREILGAGGQGWVLRASWNGSVDVVVKVLRPDAMSAASLARFRRDADVLRSLSQQPYPNPHVVRFYDHGEARVDVPATRASWTLPFTVLELVDGITLARALLDARPRGLALARARLILRHVVLALEDVHAQNILHRALKPSNILLSARGDRTREIAKVTDFGLAGLPDPGVQPTAAFAGATLAYAPPEQFEHGSLRVGRHTDVFSLAAVFYELVTGLPAFPCPAGEHPLMAMVRILTDARPAFGRVTAHLPPELGARPDVVAALDAELSRALSPSPEQRHATASELRTSLERLLAAVAAEPSGTFPSIRQAVVSPEAEAPMSARGSTAHGEARALVGDAAAVRGGGAAPPSVRGSLPSVAPRRLAWRQRSPGVVPGGLLSIAVSPPGDAAVGAGPYGLARWDGSTWLRLDAHARLGAHIDPTGFRAGAWFEGNAIFAGASPVVIGVAPDGRVDMWQFDLPGVAFHGAWIDAKGVLLVGERATAAGVVGLVARLALRGRPGAQRAVDVPGCGPLRAVTRVGRSVLACGDDGVVIVVEPSGDPIVTRVCAAPLHALLALQDGREWTAMAVGGGGFVFRVRQNLGAQLEAMQTTRDLHTLAVGPDGGIWCGGDAQRVLRREASGWMRMGSLEGTARVRALHLDGTRVQAFADDGAVLEGRA